MQAAAVNPSSTSSIHRYATVIGLSDKYEPISYSYSGIDYERNGRPVRTDFSDEALFNLTARLSGRNPKGASTVKSLAQCDEFLVFGTRKAWCRGAEEKFYNLWSEWDVPKDVPKKWIEIPEGKNEDEIREILQAMITNLGATHSGTQTTLPGPSTKLSINTTHGFRSQQMMLLLSAMHLDLLGLVRWEDAYYAHIEEGKGRAEFIDLTDILTAARQAAAVQSLRGGLIESAFRETINEISRPIGQLKPNCPEHTAHLQAKTLLEQIEILLQSLQTNNLVYARSSADQLASLNPKDYQARFPMLAPVQMSLSDLIERVRNLDDSDLISFSQVALEAGLYASAVTLLHEGALTKACEMFDLPDDVQHRTALGNEIRGERDADLSDRAIAVRNEFGAEWLGKFGKLANRRNEMNHAFTGRAGQDAKNAGKPREPRGIIASAKAAASFFSQLHHASSPKSSKDMRPEPSPSDLSWSLRKLNDPRAMIAQFQIETADGLLHADMLSNIELPNELTVQDFTDGIVFSGKGPVWLYSLLTHLAHPFAWVGVHDPRLGGAVVVQKHSSNGPELGTVVHFDL